jgi:alkylation response protein AidB-like acyl-CoA dehydrogenase
VKVLDDWNSCGSNSILVEDVFVPEESIVLERPSSQWPAVWSMVVVVAFPVFLAPCLGIAERAKELAAAEGKKRWARASDPHQVQLMGELENHLMSAQLAWQDMVRTTNNYEFDVNVENANRSLMQKTILIQSCIKAVEKAIEASGGVGFYRSLGLEQLFRDVMAGSFHPLTPTKQEVFTGCMTLGLDPITCEPTA